MRGRSFFAHKNGLYINLSKLDLYLTFFVKNVTICMCMLLYVTHCSSGNMLRPTHVKSWVPFVFLVCYECKR